MAGNKPGHDLKCFDMTGVGSRRADFIAPGLDWLASKLPNWIVRLSGMLARLMWPRGKMFL